VRIQVKTVGTLNDLEEGSQSKTLEVPQGNSVGNIIEKLNLQDWEIGFVQINGQRATKESVLKENDHLTLIAPLVGG
jgi:sulfur carrier protein ThiS